MINQIVVPKCCGKFMQPVEVLNIGNMKKFLFECKMCGKKERRERPRK